MTELIVALDNPDEREALALAEELMPAVDFFKVGLSLFAAAGPAVVDRLKSLGASVFLDLKFHDIPAQVEGVCRIVGAYGVDMVTVHTFGGLEMMRAAQRGLIAGASGANRGVPIAVGVTVLTSLDAGDLEATGVTALPQDQVGRLAALAEGAGLAGVVASALEIPMIRTITPKSFKVVTPGIRPLWADVGDQKRVATPAEAAKAGADYVVVGRPITGADDSSEAADRIIEELVLK